MDRRTWQAGAVGGVLSAAGLVLRQFVGEGPQFLLFPPTMLIAGVVTRGVRRGFLVGLVVTAGVAVVNTALFMPETFKAFGESFAVAAAAVVIVLSPALVGGALGALGGLIGRLVFRRRAAPSPGAQT